MASRAFQYLRLFLALVGLAVVVPVQAAWAIPCGLTDELKREKGPDYSLLKTDLFTVVTSRPGKYGGRILKVKTRGPWSDMRFSRSREGDAIIDMRVPIKVLGKDVAEFFGFKQIDDFTMEIPDAKAIEGAINKFNDGLAPDDPRRILILPEEVNKIFQPELNYHNRLLKHSRVPVSRRGRQFYHDILAHAWIGMLLDNQVVSVLKHRDQILDGFENFATPSLNSPVDRMILKKAINKFNSDTVSEFDNLGRLVSTFMRVEDWVALRESGEQAWPKNLSELGHIPAPELDELKASVRTVNVDPASASPFRWRTSIGMTLTLPASIDRLMGPYMNLMRTQRPEWFRELPYDLKIVLRDAANSRAMGFRHRSEELWRENPFAEPFVLRLERARELQAKEAAIP